MNCRQRLNWHKLNDEQLRERDIKYLGLLLDSQKEGDRITGAVVARCIGAISRKCSAVKTTFEIQGIWPGFTKQLEDAALPNVTRLELFLGSTSDTTEIGRLREKVWELAFSGTTFPDLRTVSINTIVACPCSLPKSLDESFELVSAYSQGRAYYSSRWTHGDRSAQRSAPFYGLRKMEKVILEYNSFLNANVLESLFGSNIMPQRLTKLEIVCCPDLELVRDLEALATLLQRGLQLLKFLKLHLCYDLNFNHERDVAYVSKINEHPEHHLCNIVRELGRNINGLDLAVPFACSRIFVPLPKKPARIDCAPLELPDIPEEPLKTLPERLMAAGYRYRRVIFSEICRGAHEWDEMATLASNQSDNVSWEILFDNQDNSAGLWAVSGSLPVEFDVRAAMAAETL